MKKKILLSFLIIFVLIQFIRPARNVSGSVSANDISKHYSIPADVQNLMAVACNDCHTNNTKYPWYTNIQPIGWWMQWHVNDGKKHLNFSEFASYPAKRQHHKMEEVVEQVKDGHMPLDSYTWIHKDAVLTNEQRSAIASWADQLRQEIAQKNGLPE